MAARTSISDTSAYLAKVTEAVESDEAFARFRVQPYLAAIFDIVGSTGMQQAFINNHLDVAEKVFPALMSLLGLARLNDTIGGAPVFPTRHGVDLSAATARYFKYLADLRHMFGRLDGWNIVEVGGAYGGLSALMHSTYQGHASHRLYDLPEVNRLAARYHHSLGVSGVSYHTSAELDDGAPVPSDLFISTHALSEINRDLQQVYIDRLVKPARHGYVLYNHFFEDEGSEIMALAEFAAQIPGCKLVADLPFVLQTDARHPSTLIVW
ncbi:hypothetical protein ACFSM5_06125 [Lacibacterium aquatile]|uniref:Class I SAM-dependent methyltransferase n=1 Tax=Lacibacterium aquatile TaxID=1168082 RepID=A0ABW5DNG7_9PROT